MVQNRLLSVIFVGKNQFACNKHMEIGISYDNWLGISYRRRTFWLSRNGMPNYSSRTGENDNWRISGPEYDPEYHTQTFLNTVISRNVAHSMRMHVSMIKMLFLFGLDQQNLNLSRFFVKCMYFWNITRFINALGNTLCRAGQWKMCRFQVGIAPHWLVCNTSHERLQLKFSCWTASSDNWTRRQCK